MAYRLEVPPASHCSRSAICLLDYAYQPMPGTSKMLEIPVLTNRVGCRVVEDCRLFLFQNKLHFHVTNRFRLGLGELDEDGNVVRFAWFEGRKAPQKNWMFFESDGSLYCVEWICPYRVSLVELNYESVHRAHPATQGGRCLSDWPYGEPHGGTNPIRFGEYFLTFFQSHVLGYPPLLPLKDDTGARRRRVYFSSCYCFSASHPFHPMLVPREPLLWPRLYAPKDRCPNGFDVVFPCGLQWLDPGNSRLMVSWGDDVRAFVSEFSTTEVLDMLDSCTISLE